MISVVITIPFCRMRPERKAALTRQPIERLAVWAQQLSDWSWQWRRLIGSVAGLGLVGLVGWGALSLMWHHQTSNGLDALRAGLEQIAVPERDPEALAGAIQSFETAAELLAGQPRQLAFWHLGHAYQQQQEGDRAVAAYHAVVADARHGDHYLVQLAWLKLGALAEDAGDTELAISQYTRAAESDGPIQAQAFLALAKVFETAGDHQQAQTYYRKFVDTADNSSLKELVEYKLDE
ncbi:MAG: tetratricopeptide repeat protein [Desulfurellaceae bacterium]|nr:tetratricopeptide repeat protein [Desulfurellaceae bacterium]